MVAGSFFAITQIKIFDSVYTMDTCSKPEDTNKYPFRLDRFKIGLIIEQNDGNYVVEHIDEHAVSKYAIMAKLDHNGARTDTKKYLHLIDALEYEQDIKEYESDDIQMNGKLTRKPLYKSYDFSKER